ncbi:MAG: acyl carrier protein [Candidatus Korobacteraceae bacterium]
MNDSNGSNDDKLKQVMADVFGVPADSINNSSTLDSIERWDSTGHLNLVLALEEQFDVRFSEDQMAEATSYPLLKRALEDLGVRF